MTLLNPAGGSAPGFVGGQEVTDPEAGPDRLMSAVRATLREEMTLFARQARQLPVWAGRLAEGYRPDVRRLGGLVRRYHAVAVAPFASQITAAVAADRAVRARAALDRGVEGLMTSYRPDGLEWSGGVLRVPCPVDADFHIDGRPMTLLPSFFATRTMAIADPRLPPVLAYPLSPGVSWIAASPRSAPAGSHLLGRFLGPGRCAVLAVLESPLSTGQLADALHLSPSAASRQAAVLREAGLISTVREGRCVRHALTSAGRELVERLRESGRS
ncbi:ArsR/SmtB family transcription factor [Kitasatospora sp. NPDC004615]|uniref:ArsR/SmtB family transcription factor n=1 Tax=Kitasatospora sp. NPDC004615 TaxID=3364017 RepID=UPI0036C30CEE